MTFCAAQGQELQQAKSGTRELKSLTRDAMQQYKLKSLLVQVRFNATISSRKRWVSQ